MDKDTVLTCGQGAWLLLGEVLHTLLTYDAAVRLQKWSVKCGHNNNLFGINYASALRQGYFAAVSGRASPDPTAAGTVTRPSWHHVQTLSL